MTSCYLNKGLLSALIKLCVFYTFLSIGGFVKINVFNDNSLFAEALVTGNVTVCVKNSKALFDEKTCKNRLHTNIDLFHGDKYYHYIFRRKDDPTKGLYIIARTSNTSVRYRLDYKISVPYFYREYTEGKTYGEVSYDPESFCQIGFHSNCTTSAKLPPGFATIPSFCCICDINVDGETNRARYNCDRHRDSIAMTYSCLEVMEPWYNLYMMSYPPDLLRNTVFSIYKFDKSNGIIPDLNLDKDGYFDNYDFKNRKNLDPSFKAEKDKVRPEVKRTSEHNKIVANYRNIIIDSTSKEVAIDDLDITISLLSSNTKNGSAPPMLDKYVAVPSFPRTNETVKGSSLIDKCMDGTWPKSLKCPKYMPQKICNYWRCTLNMRTIERDAVDTGGSQCNKIGYSYTAHDDHWNLCQMRASSCINRQLKWYLDEKKDQAKMPNFYGVEPAITIDTTQVPRSEDPEKKRTTWFQEDRIHYINYVHSEDDVSRYKIDTFEASITEIIADFPGFILSTKIDKECKLNSPDICTLQVDVKNMGTFKLMIYLTGVNTSHFTINALCYADETSKAKENVIAEIDETTLNIKGNTNKLFNIPIKLSGPLSSEKSYCFVNLLSGTKKHLDAATTSIKIKKVKPVVGMDPKYINPDVHTVSINVVPKQGYVEKSPPEPSEKKSSSTTKEKECTCATWNIFCMLFNFKTCVIAKVSKVFTYIMIGLGIFLFIILLPVIIPLFGGLINLIVKLCKMPYNAMERRRLEKMNTKVSYVNPADMRKEDLNDMKLAENTASLPGINVNLNLSDVKEQSRRYKPYEDPNISVQGQSLVESIESIASIHNKNGKSGHDQL
ncbi:conserved hypothetical protein [Theileria orientalis strain Shintoku]|uniref:Generative cell specific-1/HAP2 domain-containing protein n=1 Tax=Theileria orientalis strain Shintoku TaxID=869250 RepID=J4CDY9_THEOR|nr:conserved hypothetical protein [Theileria orientalis strain Shintoku]BAM41972.1 conserved hypothetical protein [Theileria orientalis strain Shintoku]|eukprot:XP_009692273.1 conserved hypothetical protein [Theileria orientalis strain Shintoku]